MAGFYSARGSIMPPLPWPTFAPPLSVAPKEPNPRMNIGPHGPDVRCIDETIDFDAQFTDPLNATLQGLARRIPEFDIGIEQMIEDQLEIPFGMLGIFKGPHGEPAASARPLPRRGLPFPLRKS